MAMNRTTVVGVFEDRMAAERAVRDLKTAGFRDDQIGVAMRDSGGTGTMAGRGEGSTPGVGSDSQAGEGAVTGGVLGGLLGAAAALLIPGVGPVIGLGLFGGSVLAAVAGGAALGALAGALVGWGIPEDEARYYQGEFEQGRTIVTVNAGARYDEARGILQDAGAYDVENRRPGGTAAPRVVADTDRVERSNVGQNADTMKLREEQLRVEKERVQSGEVRIGKEVVSEEKTIDVPVTKEEVVIERTAVNRPSNTPISGESRTISVPVTEERVTVEKETVVTEEIGVRKTVHQDTQQVSGTVRREEARIETAGNVPMAGAGARMTWESAMPGFRQNSGARWQQEEPYYRYGFDQYNSGKWSGRSWSEVEPEFRRDFEGRYPGKWDVASNPIKHAWDHLTATPHTHTR